MNCINKALEIFSDKNKYQNGCCVQTTTQTDSRRQSCYHNTREGAFANVAVGPVLF